MPSACSWSVIPARVLWFNVLIFISIVNTVLKIDCHYYGMFGFLARTTSSMLIVLILNSHGTMSPLTQPPQSTIASFQTMRSPIFQHVNPKFINPLLEPKPLEEVLGLWT